MKFEITSTAGYNTKENGQHGTELNFAIIGDRGAIVWRFSTGVSPLGPWPSKDRDAPLLEGVNISRPMSMGVFGHSELTPENASEPEYHVHDSCEYLEGRACVADYTQFSDTACMKALAAEGIEGVRKVLEQKYLNHYRVAP